jgi:hypothetical protein
MSRAAASIASIRHHRLAFLPEALSSRSAEVVIAASARLRLYDCLTDLFFPIILGMPYPSDHIFPYPLEQDFDRKLQQMGQQQRMGQGGDLRPLLPAAHLCCGLVAEQRRETLARESSLAARDAEAVLQGKRMWLHGSVG